MGKDIREWNPEDENFWREKGAPVAWRTLWVSIPCLLCGFAVWLYWSVITVQMVNLNFPFSKADLFTLNSIAGLTGATLRIPSSFFIRIAGGRNTLFFTTVLLIAPALGTGYALQDTQTPLWVFQCLAFLCGLGGGNFASSMSNISFYFPKKVQGLSLGLNAGLGNFGVTTMQVVIPFVMTFGLFGGQSMTLVNSSGTLIGKIPAGSPTWIFNAGFVWAAVLIPLCILAWRYLNNITEEHVSPKPGPAVGAFGKISVMLLAGFVTSALGLWLILPASAYGSGLNISKWIVLPVVIGATVGILALLPGLSKGVRQQYRIFKHPHTWIMTIIYTMTFGSFIGYSAAFPLSIKVIFGFQHIMGPDGILTHSTPNPLAPSALTYAWMGPFIGALIRPVGGWLSDRFGGALITQICSLALVLGAGFAAYIIEAAYSSATPEEYFPLFFTTFLVLFFASGVGNGSTFRTIAVVFERQQTGPVLGWTSAVAAYGAFIIPIVFGEELAKGSPQNALYGLGAFYVLCLLLNGWVYLRPKAAYRNP